nr:hypothetical protein [Burkholderia anthina]
MFANGGRVAPTGLTFAPRDADRGAVFAEQGRAMLRGPTATRRDAVTTAHLASDTHYRPGRCTARRRVRRCSLAGFTLRASPSRPTR